MKILIKPLSAKLIRPLASIEKKDGDAHWTRADFEKELGSSISRFFVLQEGDNILGYGGYWKVGEEAQITNLVVPAKNRRQGMGRILLKHLMHRAKAEGCQYVTLEVRSRNKAAQSLYHTAGFILQGRRPKAYTQPSDDAYLMQKEL